LENKDAKFLDPCTKSGVFLREITARLTQGLEKKIPNLEKRVDHILSKQVYGIGITKLTSLLARRSVYCSKSADGQHSIAKSLNSKNGNIWYENLRHHWDGERCLYCGASKTIFNRDDTQDRHAYAFIHENNSSRLVKEIFGEEMEFDVIIGNPPYQLSDGGAKASASPIYQNFVTQAKNLNPRYMSMVIPSRWFTGGKGLDEFRNEMLNDSRLSALHDFPNSTDCFPGVDLSGGVCYFLWGRAHSGKCAITTYIEGNSTTSIRPLLEKGVESFIRYNEAVSILEKIKKQEGKNFQSFSDIVSSRKPFGFTTDFNDFKVKEFKGSINFLVYNKVGYVFESQISHNKSWVNRHKVYVSMAYGERISSSYWVLGKPFR
jgi:site-specific DNA-methyltransferase (adenine-specific)